MSKNDIQLYSHFYIYGNILTYVTQSQFYLNNELFGIISSCVSSFLTSTDQSTSNRVGYLEDRAISM